MKLFPETIEDLESVITSTMYPIENAYKLHQRLGMAYQSLNQFEAASKAFDNAVVSVDKYASHLSTKQKAKISHECTNLKHSNRKRAIAMSFTNIPEAVVSPATTFEDRLVPNKHPQILGFSDAVGVKYSPARGRFAEASRDIKTGECLVIEKAITSYVMPKNSLKNCYVCHKDTISPVPCDRCAGSVFCSLVCKNQGDKR